ncbi:MAG: hypothetical protein HQL05_15615, partial [Nitrospirae bacterium]|nr:hypothetical protein [Nitrospirota bacterium]
MTKGDKNSLLFNESALILFDKIKQFKTDEITITEIRKRLGYSPEKQSANGYQTPHQNIQNIPEPLAKRNQKSLQISTLSS